MCVRLNLHLVLCSSHKLPAPHKENYGIVEALKKEVQTLRSRCDAHEKEIEDLKSKFDTHENVLEMLRQNIVRFQGSQNTLNTTYLGENYDLMP